MQDGSVPIKTLAPQIERLMSEHSRSEIVWLSVPHLKRVEAGVGDLVVCSVHDRFVVEYDDPAHAEHGGLCCPLHDEPRWR